MSTEIIWEPYCTPVCAKLSSQCRHMLFCPMLFSPNHHFIFLVLIYTVQGNNITSLQSWPEKGEKGNLHLYVFFDRIWNEDMVGVKNTVLPPTQKQKSQALRQWKVIMQASVDGGHIWISTSNTYIKKTFLPPPWQSPHSVRGGNSWIYIDYVKGIEEKELLNTKASDVGFMMDSERGGSCFQIFLLCVRKWKCTNCFPRTHILLAQPGDPVVS